MSQNPVLLIMPHLNIVKMLHIQNIFSTQDSSLELSRRAEVFSLKILVTIVLPLLANEDSFVSEMESFHFRGFKMLKNPVRNNPSCCTMS